MNLCRTPPSLKYVSGAPGVFPSPQKPTLANFKSIWNAQTRLNKFLRTPKCFDDKQIKFCNVFTLIPPGIQGFT